MKKYVNLFVFVFMIGACLSQGRAQTKSAVSYKNPVVDIAMPDPTVISRPLECAFTPNNQHINI